MRRMRTSAANAYGSLAYDGCGIESSVPGVGRETSRTGLKSHSVLFLALEALMGRLVRARNENRLERIP